MLYANFFLTVYIKIAMFMPWENIVFYTESKVSQEKH